MIAAKVKPSPSSTYGISNVRDSGGRNEYVITVSKDGKPMGDVRVRATVSAPAYYSDPKRGDRED